MNPASALLTVGAPFAAAEAWSPANLPGLELWFRADAGVLTDVDGVYQWNDQSGNARNATQATGSAKPALQTDIQNGLPGVYFTTDDFLAIAHDAGLALTDLTYCAAIKSASSAAYRCLISKSTLQYPETFDFYLTNADPPVARFNRGSLGDSDFLDTADTLANATAHLVTFRDLSKTATAKVNGAASGSDVLTSTYTDGGSEVRVGRRTDGATQFDGWKLEWVLCSVALSDLQVGQLEAYMNGRWAIF